MNANKQDAGGLLPDELEAAIQDVADHANSDGDFVSNETERATENLRMKIRAYGEQCRAASGLADHEACALVDSLIDAVWDEANSAHKGTTGECVNAAKETERVKHELLRALSRGVPEGK